MASSTNKSGFSDTYFIETYADNTKYSNKTDFYLLARNKIDFVNFTNPIKYTSNISFLKLNEEPFDKIFLMESDLTSKPFTNGSLVNIPILKNNEVISAYSPSLLSYKNFYGISTTDNSLESSSKIQILSNSGKHYPITSILNNGSIITNNLAMKDFNPEPYCRRLPGINDDPIDSSIKGGDYATGSWPASKSFGAFKTFAIEAIINNLEQAAEDSRSSTYYKFDKTNGCINKNNLHTSKISPVKINDSYAGVLGYSKKWAGYVMKLYYVKEKEQEDFASSGTIKTTYNVYVTGYFLGCSASQFKSNLYIYGKPYMTDFVYTRKKVWTNVPPMINVELQAGGGPGDSPISIRLNNFWYSSIQGSTNDPGILGLKGGGSGAYGHFSLYMTPTDGAPTSTTKPQAVFYIGLGGLASDSRHLGGFTSANSSREYGYNIYCTNVLMDGFSSLAIGSNISFELEGGCNGGAFVQPIMPSWWKYKPGTDTGNADGLIGWDNLVRVGIIQNGDTFDTPISTVVNDGRIHIAKGNSNVLGIIIPNHLFNGVSLSDQYYTSNIKSEKKLDFNPANPFNTSDTLKKNIIRLTNEYNNDYSDRDIHSGEELTYGSHGYNTLADWMKNNYATNVKEWASKNGSITGHGGAPSIFSKGGNAATNAHVIGKDPENPNNTYTYDQREYDYATTAAIKSIGMYGRYGSGGAGGCGICNTNESSSIVNDPYSEFFSYYEKTSPANTDQSIRGGDGGNGCINIIF